MHLDSRSLHAPSQLSSERKTEKRNEKEKESKLRGEYNSILNQIEECKRLR